MGERIKHDSSEYIPIPLKCDDHKGSGYNTNYKVGFVGRLFTHPCRYDIFNELKDIPGYSIHDSDKTPNNGEVFKDVTRKLYLHSCTKRIWSNIIQTLRSNADG